MLDPASIERLAAFPEKNDPLLNVALAEEGGGDVLLSLARCAHLGAEALDVIAARVAEEAALLTSGDEEPKTPAAPELERELIGHPNTPGAARDAILMRNRREGFFVLSAAAHPVATPFALEEGASWPAASPLHDRPWLVLMEATKPSLLGQWAEGSEALREAAATLANDASILGRLAADSSRRVRRAVASNRHAIALRQEMAARDPAVEVRARAARPVATAQGASAARFAAALRAMEQGGILSGDVRDALLSAGASLDEEGAFLGARYLGSGELRSLVSQATAVDADPLSERGTGVAVGLGLRCTASQASESEGASLTNEIVHLTMRHPGTGTSLTGKARAAHWIAECLGRSRVVGGAELVREIVPRTLASDRMVLFRWAARARASLSSVCSEDARLGALPLAVVELCWRDPTVGDEAAVALCSRLAPTARSERELPEDEIDLAPLRRPLPVLERAVLAALTHAPPSPRAALAAIALDPRRCRYILSAMPTWKGTLTGARLARVLRSHAGALSAAARSSGAPAGGGTARAASVARWTDRRLSETEAAIAIAVGDLTAPELVRRLVAGSIKLDDGVTMAAGVEARAAIDGASTFAPLVDYATSRRTKDAAALALWMLLEELDRVRAPSLIASAIDGLSLAGSVVAPAVCEALATLERRSPGRLENVHAQSPRGRATIASAIARAYRAFGGMRDEG
jgi:hypothetical protein